MDNPLSSLDWSLVQAFLAVAETGSLSAAARKTDTSQPTLGRQVQRMEASLGLTLFHRRARGLELSEQGQIILPAARMMQEAAGRMALVAAGQDLALAGVVRITASDVVSHFVLPKILVNLRRAEPGIQIELVPSDTTENLLFREADIAIRMYRPAQLDVITRHVGDMQIGIFGARAYLDHVGIPATIEDAMNLDFVGFDRNDLMVQGMAALGLRVSRDWFPVRTDDQAAYWHLVRAGCGLGIGQLAAVAADDTIIHLFPDLPIAPLPIWLTAHEAMRKTPRVRRVWDLLALGLQEAIVDPRGQAR